MNIGLLKPGSRVTIKENAHLEFFVLALQQQTTGTPHLTEAINRDFLRHVLPELLQDVDLQTRIHLWFMHDGAPRIFILQSGHS
jgi:hypothetical protein